MAGHFKCQTLRSEQEFILYNNNLSDKHKERDKNIMEWNGKAFNK